MTLNRPETRANPRQRGFALAQSLPPIAVWAVPLLLYAATTARGVLAADSGEFQLVAARWGIAHPPGYPLYTVVGALWVRLIPWFTVPFRLNLLSAVLAIVTLWLMSKAVTVWARAHGAEEHEARGAGALAALGLGLASTFWAQATTANIRMPTMLFTAWGYLAVARYRAAQGSRGQARALSELALALGLGIGHHPSLAFIAVGWGLYVLTMTPDLLLKPRRWAGAALIAAMAWGIPQLYLPLRSGMENVPFDPGNLATWQGFWNHVLARGFSGDMFAYATLNDLTLRLPLLPTLFRMQYPGLVLAAMGLGWLRLLRCRPRLACSLLISWIVMTFITITYRAPQTIEYLMPAYVPMAITLGLGLTTRPPQHVADVKSQRRRLGKLALTALLLGSLLVTLPGKVRDFALQANSTAVRERVEPLLAGAPEDSLILADWRWATPLWVLQTVEDKNPNAEVRYVLPERDLGYEEVWRRQADQAGERPLYTTHRFTWEAWTFAPVGGGYRLYPRPLTELPKALGFAPLGDVLAPIRLLGYKLDGEAVPGRAVELQLAWQAMEAPNAAPSFAARLWDANGAVLAAADRALDSNLTPGEIHVTALTLQLPIDRCTGAVYPTIGVYTVVDGGFQDLGNASLPEVQVECRYPRLPTRRPHPGLVSGGPFLRGIDYDVQAAGSLWAYTHWCGPGGGILLRSGGAEARIEELALGACQTARLPLDGDQLKLTVTRLDGTPVRLVTLPLPKPVPGERYLPYGNKFVLIGSAIDRMGDPPAATRLTLTWETTRPIEDDYAVSVRLRGAQGAWLGMHDMQPGLGALPTLKWVTRGGVLLDPHVFPKLEEAPASFSLVVYERFRMTPLKSPFGDETFYELP